MAKDQNEDQIGHARGAYIRVHPHEMSPDLLAALARLGWLVSGAFSISPEDAGEAETSQKSGQDEAFRKWRINGDEDER